MFNTWGIKWKERTRKKKFQMIPGIMEKIQNCEISTGDDPVKSRCDRNCRIGRIL